jgi:hypothetical protein
MKKSRLAGLVLPLAFLLPVGASAQSADCDLSVGIFDSTGEACAESLVDTQPTKAEVLKVLQAEWDSIAKIVGKQVAILWLGPRPDSLSDIWWL